MEREILFRGKTADNAKWVEGNLIIDTYNKSDNIEKSYRIVNRVCGVDELGYITYESCIDEKINQSTIGQYTGLTDRNGKRIFEGDIVLKRTYNGKRPFPVTFNSGMFHAGYGGGSSTATHGYTLDDRQIEAIGNIYDNPELLERGRDD